MRRIVTGRDLGATSIALALLVSATAWAGGGPENVFLLVNPRGAQSMEVANAYIALRRIPPNNVFYLPTPPRAVRMTGLDFREKILKPTLEEIDRRGLSGHIDYVVYSCDFPWQLDFSAMLGLPNVNELKRPILSLTGATYLYQFVQQGSELMVELGTNKYCVPGDVGPSTTRAFRSNYLWGDGGARVQKGGIPYLLCTQLGCSQPEGNTVDEMKAYLKRAVEADGTRPEGTFYYMKNTNIRSTARDAGFPAAVRELRALGLQAQVGNGIVPQGAGALLGLTTGAVHVRIEGSGSELAPGALVDNLTSSGGILTRVQNPKPQTRISEYMRAGAAGASGTVIEPFAVQPKFPTPALHVHYARGSSLAEAFYQSVQGPFQLLILGDPLCQPWAFIPKVSVEGVEDGTTVTGTIDIKPSAELYGKRAIARYDFYLDGRQQAPRKPGQTISLDTTKLADGYHELRVVAVDDSPVETQGRWIGGVTVANGNNQTSLTSPAGARVTGAQVILNVNSTVDGITAVFHNNREVGRIKGRNGVVTIPVEKLGLGPVTLDARTLGKTPLRSAPLTLEIR